MARGRGADVPRGLPAIRGLALAAAIGTYILIVFGSIVRASGSGLGCPDWPLCHGQVIPPPQLDAWIEWTHRTIGALVSVLILALCVSGLMVARQTPGIVRPAVAIPFLLAAQIVLGAVVVKLDLNSTALFVHLGFALIILALLVWIAVRTYPVPRATAPIGPGVRRFTRLALIGCAAVFGLLMTGALVRASYASWACAGFPTCNGALLPFGVNRQVDIHLLHRLTAIALVVLVSYLLVRTRKDAPEVPVLRRAAHVMTALIGLQFLIGVLAVTTGVPPLTQVLHVAGASALWASIVALAALAWRAGRSGAAIPSS